MIPNSMARNLITMAVMDAMTTDDKIVMYVRFSTWETRMRDLLLDEARQEVFIENIETHYEDIESLNICYAYLMLSETCKELCFTKYVQTIQLVALPPSW